LGVSPATATWSFNFFTTVVPAITETNASLVIGSIVITDGTDTFTDQGDGTLKRQDGNLTSTINYETGAITLNRTVATAAAFTATASYYPALPVMGITKRENTNSVRDETVFFDQKYAYNFLPSATGGAFEEFLPGTTWTGTNSEFFWTTNYFIDKSGFKVFWATNYSVSGDPIRYTNGQATTNWVDFTPRIDAANNLLLQALALLPFRGRLLAFNTKEGTISPGQKFSNRIRWAAIGTPFTVVSPIVTSINADAWRDDIRGKGGFLDIPTTEDIISVGFVRDNLVIYCEHSTWQLRYTGRTIAPFQIEKVNSELGATSTFSAVQFDTSLLGVGDKGIVECDSFKSERVDIKIPDLVFKFQNDNAGNTRVHGIRDFINRLAYWTFPSEQTNIYPDRRLVYNYENDSWAIFTDSLTALGTFQVPSSRTWINTHLPWIECNFAWIDQPVSVPTIVGGNQQGFIEYLDETTTNDPSLYISSITSNTPNATIVTSPDHNLVNGQIIKITGIIDSSFTNLNDGIFSVNLSASDPFNSFELFKYNPDSQTFSTPQIDPAPVNAYIVGGLIAVRDNFNITSKKFNYVDEGQSIQLGYIDILCKAISEGSFSLNVYLDYDDSIASNTLPKNVIADDNPILSPDTFFNSIIPTSQAAENGIGGSKYFQRVYCATRATFLTIQYTFNNAQMAGLEQQKDVEIDSQVLWMRKGGRITQI
jgi:hypothetical protein